MTRIREIHFWGDGSHVKDHLGEIATRLEHRVTGVPIVTGGNIWDRVERPDLSFFSRELARARVFDLFESLPIDGDKPIRGEIDYEEGRILGKNASTGILYDGFMLSAAFRSVPVIGEGSLGTLHIILTDRLIGTFDRSDRRYHARVVVFGYPHVLSTTGVIEAPARPREFYLIRRHYRDAGIIPPGILEPLRGRYIEYGDSRIGEVLEGYALQCLFYQATGDPFCDDRECCLYNAHWQEEMIHSQLGRAEKLCARHGAALASITKNVDR